MVRKSLCALAAALALQFSTPAFSAPQELYPLDPSVMDLDNTLNSHAYPQKEKKDPFAESKDYLKKCDKSAGVGVTRRGRVVYPTLTYLNIGCKHGFRFHQMNEPKPDESLKLIDGFEIKGEGDIQRFLAEYESRSFLFGGADEIIGAKVEIAWLFGIAMLLDKIAPNEDKVTYNVEFDFQVGAMLTITGSYRFWGMSLDLQMGRGYVKKELFAFTADALEADKETHKSFFDPATFVPQNSTYLMLSFYDD